jgi:hypothetical protein
MLCVYDPTPLGDRVRPGRRELRVQWEVSLDHR